MNLARQGPLSTGFSRQVYHSGLPFPCPGDLPDPGIEARSLALQADSLSTELSGNSHKYSYTSQILTKVVLVVQDAFLLASSEKSSLSEFSYIPTSRRSGKLTWPGF